MRSFRIFFGTRLKAKRILAFFIYCNPLYPYFSILRSSVVIESVDEFPFTSASSEAVARYLKAEPVRYTAATAKSSQSGGFVGHNVIFKSWSGCGCGRPNA